MNDPLYIHIEPRQSLHQRWQHIQIIKSISYTPFYSTTTSYITMPQSQIHRQLDRLRQSHIELLQIIEVIGKLMQDPSLSLGFIELYQQIIKMHIKSDAISFDDDIMVRIFRNAHQYKIELTSENNISFLYELSLTQKELQDLTQNSKEELLWFKNMFSGQSTYHFKVMAEEAQLVIEEREKFKNYQLGSFRFQIADQNLIKESLMYRYQRMQIREKLIDNYWQNMCNLVKTKNPSLLLQMDQRYKKNIFK